MSDICNNKYQDFNLQAIYCHWECYSKENSVFMEITEDFSNTLYLTITFSIFNIKNKLSLSGKDVKLPQEWLLGSEFL